MRTGLGEAAVRAVNRRAPGLAREFTSKIAAQPSDYSREALRTVSHLGLTWSFRPADYFQWHHYLAFPDPVLDALRALVRPTDTVVDVGANIGLYSVVLAQRARRVIAFEPHPETHERLSFHANVNRADNVVVERLALGADASVAPLSDPGTGDSGKFTLRSVGASASSGLMVSTSTLDQYVASHGIDRIDLLKIDVEGHEPEVLAGGMETLRRDRPRLVVEISPHWYVDRWPRFLASLDLLESLYSLYDILPSTHNLALRRAAVSRSSGSVGQRNLIAMPRGEELPPALRRALVAGSR